MSYLRDLRLFVHSGVQHILCYVFVLLFVVLLYTSMLAVSLDCFCFVFLRLVYPMLAVSLDCPFLLPLRYSLTLIQYIDKLYLYLNCPFSSSVENNITPN